MTTPIFSQQQQQQTPFSQKTQFFQQTQQLQQHQFYLFNNDKAPASYSTKWADLHPDSQRILLQIGERILEYKDESQRLDQCSQLYDSSVLSEGFEIDASQIVQELGGVSAAMERQKALLRELTKERLRNTEMAIRSFMMLQPRFVHPNPGGASTATMPSRPPGATATLGSTGQPASTAIVPVFNFYSGLLKKPSPFLRKTVARFEKYLGECCQWIEELEHLLLLDSDRNSSHPGFSLLQCLPKVMSNVHDFFVHVAAKVESIHQHIESMRMAYLADQHRRGDGNDPTLHLPVNLQPSAQGTGLFASSATPAASTAPQTFAATAAASSGSGLFSTPSSTVAVSSLFAPSSTSAPVSTLFGPSGASPQSTLFGTSSSSLFSGSTPSLFSNTASSFASTPAGGSLFSTPFATGAATGSEASFGTVSKASRPRSGHLDARMTA